ncbi:MAG: type II secretion system protein [Candidatus Electrothrix sp. GW3-4]|uniref:pilus assembly FimT family protein n=1 Tax=Candidatus Electrothrix sp. GW3-4 TaxID=3126740 RepID=UPI0030CA5FA6
MRTRTDQRGFTLLELIIVMVLISLTASFTLPRIQSSLYTNELRATAQRFVGLVTEVAQEARAKHTAFFLRFDADEKAFLVLPASSEPETEEGKGKKNSLQAKLDESVTLEGIETQQHEASTGIDDTGIFFTTKGYTRKAAIHFEGENGDQISVILSPFLGVARILKGHVSLEDDRMTVSR